MHTQTPNIHALSRIRTHDPGFRASEYSACPRPFGYRDRRLMHLLDPICLPLQRVYVLYGEHLNRTQGWYFLWGGTYAPLRPLLQVP
jgi:predicted membrane protein